MIKLWWTPTELAEWTPSFEETERTCIQLQRECQNIAYEIQWYSFGVHHNILRPRFWRLTFFNLKNDWFSIFLLKEKCIRFTDIYYVFWKSLSLPLFILFKQMSLTTKPAPSPFKQGSSLTGILLKLMEIILNAIYARSRCHEPKNIL